MREPTKAESWVPMRETFEYWREQKAGLPLQDCWRGWRRGEAVAKAKVVVRARRKFIVFRLVGLWDGCENEWNTRCEVKGQ